jgi:cytosine/adenosine deaminase-related metal-dependent hydrolase
MGWARVLRRNEIGHLTVGAKADSVTWDVPSYLQSPYRMCEIQK